MTRTDPDPLNLLEPHIVFLSMDDTMGGMISLTGEQAQFVANVLHSVRARLQNEREIFPNEFGAVIEQYTALAADIELQIKRQRSFDDLTGSEKMEWIRAEGSPPPRTESWYRKMGWTPTELREEVALAERAQ